MTQSIDFSGNLKQSYHNNLTGFINYNDRLVAAQRKKDPTLSPHDSTQVLRRKIPKVVSKSIVGIDPFLFPAKQGAKRIEKPLKIELIAYNDRYNQSRNSLHANTTISQFTNR